SVICKVICAGVNPVDAKGLVGDKLPGPLAALGKRLLDGRGVGFDFAGVVEDVPPGVSTFKRGDAVYGTVPIAHGSFAQFVKTPLHQIAHKPAHLSFAEAAALPLVGITAVQALTQSNSLKPGEHLLLIGASGGVGHVAIQETKALGARVTAVCSGRNSALVSQLGADFLVDYTAGETAIKRQLVGRPFDLCLDCVFSFESKRLVIYCRTTSASTAHALRIVLLTGKYVTIGGGTPDWLRAGVRRTLGFNLFPKDRELFWIVFPHTSEALAQLAAWADAGKLRPRVASEVPLEIGAVRQAFANLHGRRVVGKQV
ncbi:hypothetical protein T484DRAFT_1600347, partial [Baffinella frigidus]